MPAGITDANMYLSSLVSCVVSRRDNFTINRRYFKSGIVAFRLSIWKSFVVGDWGCLIISKGDEGARFQWGGCELNGTVNETTNDYQSNLYTSHILARLEAKFGTKACTSHPFALLLIL